MKKRLSTLLLAGLFLSLPLYGSDWSVGGGSGVFVFGKFVERSLRGSTGGGPISVSKVNLSARSRPGLSLDVEHGVSDRIAVRLEGTFTHAPLTVRSERGEGVALDAGSIDATTVALPLVVRLNPHGTFRFNLMGGPAYAMYHIKRHATPGSAIAPFEGTRSRSGVTFGGGIEWWFSSRWAAEGRVSEIVTGSPFRKSDFAAPDSITIPRSRHTHTTAGIRLRF
jgi:opacity protein-like surface antigen